MSKKKEKLVIIDGNALIHRSFHALPVTLTTKTGEIVNAVYGFTAFLLRAIKELKPDYLILTLDKKGKTFRHEKYTEYKATRKSAPDELYAQFGRVREMATILNIPIYEEAGFEADDLIGTISKTVDHNIEKVIVTGDMDTLQLVDESTQVYAMSRGINESVLYDEQAVRSRYGLEPEQIIDYKGLRGDPSDNIPGVKGIGEKTAVELLQEFETIENLYANLDKVAKERTRMLLTENKDNAVLSKELATIKVDVPIELDLEHARFGGFDREAVARFFTELEFKSLLNRLHEMNIGESPTQIPTDKFERNRTQFKYTLIDDEKKFQKFLGQLGKAKIFAFDTETTGLDYFTAELLGISISWKEGEAYFIQIKDEKEKTKDTQGSLFEAKKQEKNTREHPWLERLKPIFADEKIKKFGHNVKFDLAMLKDHGIVVGGLCFDTMLASYLLNPGTRQHNLDALAFTELHFEKITREDLLGKGKVDYTEAPLEKLNLYACEDADITFRLKKKLEGHLKEQKLEKLLLEMELPLAVMLVDVEQNGIRLDVKYLEKLSDKLHARIKELEKEIHAEAGSKFNINSTQQLSVVLFEDLAISPMGLTKTKTGISTAADELLKIRDEHPIVKLIEEYRELTKLTSTYIDALPKLVHGKTSRIHTSYNQTIAATGRLSSTDPNLQNIPVKSEWGREVRKAFVAEKGYKLLALDYSQIELRLAAHFSQDKTLIKSFKNNLDIHTSTAAAINQVELSEVTKEMRRAAKAVNFGVLYGQGPHGLAQTADIPYWQAKQFIDQYFEVFPGIKKYVEEKIKFAQHYGYVETLFGRKRYLPEINSGVLPVRRAAERMAVNTPLQGTAADMIKAAMIEVDKYLRNKHKPEEIRMLLQVHDELIFEVREDLVSEIAPEIKKIMEGVMKLKVPIIAEIKSGYNWGELE
jgi:DNA polymerase-1